MPKTCESCRFVNKVEAKDLSGNTTFVAFDCTHPALQRGSDVDPGDNGWRTPANYGCTFHKPVKNPREWRVTRLEGQDATKELRKLCRHLKRQAEDTGSSTKYRVRLTKTGIALEISDESDQLAEIDAEITESARLVHRRRREMPEPTELGRAFTALRTKLESD